MMENKTVKNRKSYTPFLREMNFSSKKGLKVKRKTTPTLGL
jgi:hypothetical protein